MLWDPNSLEYEAYTPEWDLISQIYQSDLASIGIKLNVVKLDQPAWLDQVNNRKYHGFWASTMAIGTGEPVSGLSLVRAMDPNSNNEGYKNDTYTGLINALASEPDAPQAPGDVLPGERHHSS